MKYREFEEGKKYYLKHKFINKDTAEAFINLVINGEVILNTHCGNITFQTKFTKAEIEEFKKRFNTDLNDFELVEVED